MNIHGKYFSFNAGSVAANVDLITLAETLSGEETIVAKKVKLVSSGSQLFSINGGANSTLNPVAGVYTLQIDNGDVLVSSIKYPQSSASPIYVELIY